MLQKFSALIKDTSLLLPSNALQTNMVIQSVWKELFTIDEELKRNVKIKYVKNDSIYFVANNSIWAQEVQLRNMEILEKLNVGLAKKIPLILHRLIIHVGTF